MSYLLISDKALDKIKKFTYNKNFPGSGHRRNVQQHKKKKALYDKPTSDHTDSET